MTFGRDTNIGYPVQASGGELLGVLATPAATGPVTSTDLLTAYIKQLVEDRGGLVYTADVTTATSTTVFSADRLIQTENDIFNGWWIYVMQADDAAPEREWRQISDSVGSTGAITHAAFTAQLAVGDVVQIIHPIIHQILTAQGGSGNLQTIISHNQAQFDIARVETIASPITLSGSVQYIYQRNPSSRPFFFIPGWVSWDSGAWGTEEVTITIDMKVDGSNWENIWTSGTINAASSPLTRGIPAEANSGLLNIPKGFDVMADNGVRVGIVQGVVGGGYGVVSHSFGDGVPGN